MRGSAFADPCRPAIDPLVRRGSFDARLTADQAIRSTSRQLLLGWGTQPTQHLDRQLKLLEGVAALVRDLDQSRLGAEELDDRSLGAPRPPPACGRELDDVEYVQPIRGH